MSDSNFPNQQNLPLGSIPVYLAINGQPVSVTNPLPTTGGGGGTPTQIGGGTFN